MVQLLGMVSAGVGVLGEAVCVCVCVCRVVCVSSGKAYSYSTTATKTTNQIPLCHKNASVLLAKVKIQVATLYLYNPLNTGVLGFHFQIAKKKIVAHCLLNPLSDEAAWNFAVVCRISNQDTFALCLLFWLNMPRASCVTNSSKYPCSSSIFLSLQHLYYSLFVSI